MTSHLQNMSSYCTSTGVHAVQYTKATVCEDVTSPVYELSTSPQLNIPEAGFINSFLTRPSHLTDHVIEDTIMFFLDSSLHTRT